LTLFVRKLGLLSFNFGFFFCSFGGRLSLLRCRRVRRAGRPAAGRAGGARAGVRLVRADGAQRRRADHNGRGAHESAAADAISLIADQHIVRTTGGLGADDLRGRGGDHGQTDIYHGVGRADGINVKGLVDVARGLHFQLEVVTVHEVHVGEDVLAVQPGEDAGVARRGGRDREVPTGNLRADDGQVCGRIRDLALDVPPAEVAVGGGGRPGKVGGDDGHLRVDEIGHPLRQGGSGDGTWQGAAGCRQ